MSTGFPKMIEPPFQLIWAILCGWLQREQEDAIACLREGDRILKARLQGRRLCLEDHERRRLAELDHRLDAGVSPEERRGQADSWTVLRAHSFPTAFCCD